MEGAKQQKIVTGFVGTPVWECEKPGVKMTSSRRISMKKNLFVGIVATLFVSALHPLGTARAEPSQAFKEMDLDADQRISKEEFMAFGAKLKAEAGKPFSEQAASESFNRRDADKDGTLSPEELAARNPALSRQKVSLKEQKKLIEEAKKKKAELAEKQKKEEEKKKAVRSRKNEEKKREKTKKSKSDDGGGDDD